MLECASERGCKLESAGLETKPPSADLPRSARAHAKRRRKSGVGASQTRFVDAALRCDHGAAPGCTALASLKQRAVARAISLMPGVIRVSVDEDYQHRALSIGWRGHGRLHLPADTQLPDTARSVRPLTMTA